MPRHTPAHPEEGCTRCYCGCKYWEDDTCIDCGYRYRPADFDADGNAVI